MDNWIGQILVFSVLLNACEVAIKVAKAYDVCANEEGTAKHHVSRLLCKMALSQLPKTENLSVQVFFLIQRSILDTANGCTPKP